MFKWLLACPLLASTALIAVQPANAAVVQAITSQMTFIGNVVAGRSYRVTVQGVVDLYVGFNNGAGLTFTPDGKPTYAFPAPYTAFSPNGFDIDPSGGPGAYGHGGPGALYGVLLGSYTANPQSYADYIPIGPSHVFVASVSGPFYAKVNDCCFHDNGGSYTVTLQENSDQVTYGYDARGRLTASTRSRGGSAPTTTQYSYDRAGNRARVLVQGASQ